MAKVLGSASQARCEDLLLEILQDFIGLARHMCIIRILFLVEVRLVAHVFDETPLFVPNHFAALAWKLFFCLVFDSGV